MIKDVKKKQGLILSNIGSPSAPEPKAVGRYLREFLMDEEILGMPKLIRFFAVNGVIVPRRRSPSALKYKKIWGKAESPLIEISKDFAFAVQEKLGPDYVVRLGMRYGEPSISQAVDEMRKESVDEILLAPLYPQYARATTASAEKKMKEVCKDIPWKSLKPFYGNRGFIQTSADKLKVFWAQKKWEHVLFSFHGLPESQIRKVQGCLENSDCCQRSTACEMNCYRAQCFATAKGIAQAAGLEQSQWTVTFQSRVGPAKWIGPASIAEVQKLAREGRKNVLVQSPSFVADCLETLEEISLELQQEFQNHGGEKLQLVPCLNSDGPWVEHFCKLVKESK